MQLYFKISDCWACTSKEYFEDITRYIQANDSNSLLKYALSGKCDLLKNETVYIVDYDWMGISKVDWNGMKLYISTNCLKN